MDGVALLTIFILSVFVGFEVVSKVSTVLHTPLMSGANAIHGIVLLGGIIVTGVAETPLEVNSRCPGRSPRRHQPRGWIRGDRPNAGNV